MIYLKEHIYDCLIWFAGLQSEQNHQGRRWYVLYPRIQRPCHAYPPPSTYAEFGASSSLILLDHTTQKAFFTPKA